MGIPNLDVLQSGTNQHALLGDGMQQHSLHAVTRIEKEDGGDFEGEEEEGESGREDNSSEADSKGRDDFGGGGGSGRNGRSSLGAVFPVASKGDTETTTSTEEAAEGQEAVRPNSGHSLGRAWPLQVRGQVLPVGGRWREERRNTREELEY
ncbi:hypothetical protein NDU88_007348 [Pleurodeles waltl]|uniref:Uncharacterized protein n=1 Tax=Pleurodeles waltl TaxID=8319 RepID=A0AAV7VQI0_PLEWA|nr:hypothetical protein NDU88_007348 [Pleurodeles waltl]